jgi:hypothetical protein
LKDLETGYVMGLIVGEGAFTGDDHKPALGVKLHASDPLPLQALEQYFGGKINGPYCHQGRVYRIWLLRGAELVRALPIFDAYLPDSRKREQYLVWKAKWHLGEDSPQIELFLDQLETEDAKP